MNRPTLRGKPRQAAAFLAAAITVAVLCAADVLARSYPFGPRTREVNDLGNQYVPFHAHLWDLLHGRADGGLFLNWQSGFGSSFLPDLGTYLGSPFALLVAVFPRDEIDLAVYVITVLKTATAGAAMAWLLLRLRPGLWWGAGLMGAAYALCGWSLADGSYNPMWLDGLIALPLLCLVGEWALSGRRGPLGVLIVALAWIANFYTAYMATLGAALVLLLRLWLAGSWRRRAPAVLGRAAATAALGVGLAAPLVTVVYFGTKHAFPGTERQFRPAAAEDVLARLMPTTYAFSTPALYVGTLTLLLALALPFHRGVPQRVRAGWSLLVVAVLLSMQWTPTHLAWHAFSTPNGSPYRQSFVLCGLLVIAAWHSLARGVPGPRALGAAAVLLALIAAVASGSGLIRPYVWPVLGVTAAAALGGLCLLGRTERAQAPDAHPPVPPPPAAQETRPPAAPDGPAPAGRRHRRGLLAGAAVVLLVGAQFGEAAATSAVDTRLRLDRMDDYAPWGARQRQQSEAVARVDGWPRYRTDPGREQTVGNDPLMVGGQGAQYYSSMTADVLSRLLAALGDGMTSRGRSVQSLDNPVTDALFSIGARLHSPPDQHQRWNPRDHAPVTVTRQDVPPLVTVRPPGTGAPAAEPEVSALGPSPYRNQEVLLGAEVYTVPPVTVRTGDGGRPPRAPDSLLGVVLEKPHTGVPAGVPTITGRCPAGSEAYLWAPHFSGTARLAGGPPTGRRPVARFAATAAKIAAMQRLGTVPAGGRFRIDLTVAGNGTVPDGAVGCLDTARLTAAVRHLRATGASEVSVSDGTLRARLPAGSTGTAVVAVPRIAGWRCAAGGKAAVPAEQYYGLIAVPLDGSATSLTCTFHPPGLRLGAAVGGASLLVLAVLGVLGAVRRRRLPGRPAPSRTSVHPRERATSAP